MPPTLLRRREFDFDFLFYPEGDQVIAHCLQTDTAAQGRNAEEARKALRQALELEIESAIEEGDLDSLWSMPAPENLWKRVGDAVQSKYAREEWLFAPDPQPYRARLKEFTLAGVH